MTTSMIQTPLDFAKPIKAGRRRFWKQILPVTEIDYDGRKIKFDPDFHKSLELSYEDKVYDQIPLVFADGTNAHNEDPRNFGGEIVHMENRGKDGTWALIEADKEAARAISKNPRLGVSARIKQGVEKGGKVYDNAVRHVLMTMFPRVQGMSPWQAVDLSDEDTDIEVVDLTAESFNKEGSEMATKTKAKATSRQIDLSSLTDEQFESLLEAMGDLDLSAVVEDPDVDEDEDLDEEVEDEEVEDTAPTTRKKKSKTKITVEKESEDDGDPEDEDDESDDDTSDLSDKVTIARMQDERAKERWDRTRADYQRDGVPPFLLDLAEPVLSRSKPVTLDLADGETVDASDTIRKMLDGVKGLIDLSPEIGHAIDLTDALVKEDADAAFLDEWDKQYG